MAVNKIILAAIALGLWANAATTVIRPAHADDGYGANIYSELSNIDSRLGRIEHLLRGTIDVHCDNCVER